MEWMCTVEDQVSGKILCPNKKCGAKLGNYDWAGMQCRCGKWVVPVRLIASPPFDIAIKEAGSFTAGILHIEIQSKTNSMNFLPIAGVLLSLSEIISSGFKFTL
jgi:hypothetical protein